MPLTFSCCVFVVVAGAESAVETEVGGASKADFVYRTVHCGSLGQ